MKDAHTRYQEGINENNSFILYNQSGIAFKNSYYAVLVWTWRRK